MDIVYRRFSPLEPQFLRPAVGIRRRETPQQHDVADSPEKEIARIRAEFDGKNAISAVAYLAIAPDIKDPGPVGYAYAFELPEQKGTKKNLALPPRVEFGGVNVRKAFRNGRDRIALTVARHVLAEFDESLPLVNSSHIMPVLLGGALDDPNGEGELQQNPDFVGQAVQKMNQILGITEQASQQEQPRQLTILPSSVYSTA